MFEFYKRTATLEIMPMNNKEIYEFEKNDGISSGDVTPRSSSDEGSHFNEGFKAKEIKFDIVKDMKKSLKKFLRAFRKTKRPRERSNSLTSMNTIANCNQPIEFCLSFSAPRRTNSMDSNGSGKARSVSWSDNIEVIVLEA
jgi:hypothetical protein